MSISIVEMPELTVMHGLPPLFEQRAKANTKPTSTSL